jgi:hypothetical protein
MSERDTRNIALSLVSHTNAGKTTLARTLLGRDVGEVRDAPHVTEFADVHTMLETADGERLLLWDTPGFGDSARLLKRLRQSSQPLGWFMSQVWDRWRDRAFWATQQALRNVRDEADVMLYLVNASEEPAAAGYVGTEMNLLAWVDKPVVVLLNQLGAPREAAVEAADIARWKSHLAPYAHLRVVLPPSIAFARAWAQELTLLRAIEAVLDAIGRRAWRACARRGSAARAHLRLPRCARSQQAWRAREHARGPAGGSALRSRLRSVGAAIGLGNADDTPAAVAQRALAERLDAEVRANTLELLQLHGIGGAAQQEILTRLARHYELRLRMDEKGAAMWGGMVTGALVGLKADVLSGGLTLGGGLLTGGLLGALGVARALREPPRGTEHSSTPERRRSTRWSTRVAIGGRGISPRRGDG